MYAELYKYVNYDITTASVKKEEVYRFFLH